MRKHTSQLSQALYHYIALFYLQDNLGEVVDPVDLQVRFRDVEFEAPSITYESLKEGGHPIDIASVQQRINQYKSVVCSKFVRNYKKLQLSRCFNLRHNINFGERPTFYQPLVYIWTSQ